MNPEKGIILGISGGIAAYKACDLIRLFVKDGFRVFPVMTPSAARFITPLSISYLASNKVYIDPFAENIDWDIEHIELAKRADVMLIAPATANIIAKIACGLADDFVSLTALTFAGDNQKPMLIAPAMNYRMYHHPATVKNMEILKNRGVIIVEPEKGELACGEIGEGKLAPVEMIFNAVIESLGIKHDFKDKKVIVTAGGTREQIDPVRFICNRSSGKMGYALAVEFKRRGADVTLVSSANLPNPGVDRFIEVTSAKDMQNTLEGIFQWCDILVMAAAVSDFTMKSPSQEKIKRSGSNLTVELVPTDDIVTKLTAIKGSRIVIGFAAEDGNPVPNAQMKLHSKNLDMIIANDISRTDTGFASDYNEVVIIWNDIQTVVEKAHKTIVARKIVDSIAELIKEKTR